MSDWFSPSSINFNREQVIWILQNLEDLRCGSWPSNHKITGYSGKRKGGINKRAYFDNPCVISAEISRRLKLTKTDGKLLKAQVQGGITEYEELEPEAQMALNFISLWDFRKRKERYSLWKAKRFWYYGRKAKNLYKSIQKPK